MISRIIRSVGILFVTSFSTLSGNPAFASDPFTPNKVWFIMGQDTGTLRTFKDEVLDVDRTFPRPSGTTIYTNIVIDEVNSAPLQGFFQTANYGGGRNDLQIQLNDYDGALAVGLWLKDVACDAPNGELRNTALRALAQDPSLDDATKSIYARWLDDMIDYFIATDRDVLLRIGYEFDGVWNCYTPETYINAFRAIKKRIDEKGASKVYTVWQTANWALKVTDDRMAETHNAADEDHLTRWYPGDEYVDIIGLSHFEGATYQKYAWPTECSAQVGTYTKSPRTLQNELLDFARAHGKRVFIAEAAPKSFDIARKTARCIFGGYQAPEDRIQVSSRDIWNTWFKDFFRFIKKNRDVIGAVAYINANWDTQPQWACTPENNCSNGYWGDSRIQEDRYILNRMKVELYKPYWSKSKLFTSFLHKKYKQHDEFVAPNLSRTEGVLEAEYASTPAMWLAGDEVSGYGAPLAISGAGRSNDGQYIIFANGGSIVFDKDVTEGKSITISYAAVTPVGSFTVQVDEETPQVIDFENTNFNLTEITIPAEISEGSELTLTLSSGNVIFFDYIRINEEAPKAN